MRLLGLIASLSSPHTRAAGGSAGSLASVLCIVSPLPLHKASRGPTRLVDAVSKAYTEVHACIQVTKETAGFENHIIGL